MSKTPQKKLSHLRSGATPPRLAALGVLVLGMMIAVGGNLYKPEERDFIAEFFPNAATELVSIAIGVLIIDWANEIRDKKRYKTELIRRMGSADRGTALAAVEDLRAENWLYDGSLRGASLTRLCPFQAAKARVSSQSWSRSGGINTESGGEAALGKWEWSHRWVRTKARTSEKVAKDLEYQAVE